MFGFGPKLLLDGLVDMLLLSRSEFSARYAAPGLVWTKYRNVSQS